MKTKRGFKLFNNLPRNDSFEIKSASISPDESIKELAKTVFEIGAKASSSQPADVPHQSAEQLKALISIANNFWRARKRMSDNVTGDIRDDMKRVHERIEAIRRSLVEMGIVILYEKETLEEGRPNMGIKIRDHTRDVYDEGQPMQVVASKPMLGLDKKRVSETLLPSIFWNDRLIQNGQIEIATPIATHTST